MALVRWSDDGGQRYLAPCIFCFRLLPRDREKFRETVLVSEGAAGCLALSVVCYRRGLPAAP